MVLFCDDARMATKTEHIVTDDITGEGGAVTVRFSLGDDTYEIDLAEGSTAKLIAALDPFIEHARKTTRSPRSAAGGAAARPRGGERTAGEVKAKAVRAWAAEQGMDLPPRGRISKDVMAQYDAATAA